jgi:hypothetical protein
MLLTRVIWGKRRVREIQEILHLHTQLPRKQMVMGTGNIPKMKMQAHVTNLTEH